MTSFGYASMCLLVVLGLQGCAVRPGSSVFEVMRAPTAERNTTVQPPRGYGPPTGGEVARGLVNPQDRAATAAYLEELSDQQSDD